MILRSHFLRNLILISNIKTFWLSDLGLWASKLLHDNQNALKKNILFSFFDRPNPAFYYELK